MTTAQKKALKTVKENVVLHGQMKNGHAYDYQGRHKLIDRRTLVVLDNEGLIEWGYDWGYNDHIYNLTDKGLERYNEFYG